LSLALPASCTGRWLEEFSTGLRRASKMLSCPLAGGDTTRRDQILLNVTVVGEVRTGRALTRSGARTGDAIFVSGRLGGAERGLELLRGLRRIRPGDPALNKHLYPEPRLALGQWLAHRRIPTAMMDLSDGLSTDLARLCAASGVGARIEASRLPVALPLGAPMAAKRSRRGPETRDAVDLALNGGDDYELLFTVRPNKLRLLPPSIQGVPLTNIGEVTRNRKLRLIHPDGEDETLEDCGWNPFRS